MSWPSVLPNSAAFDADADSVAASRPELKKMSDAVNNIVNYLDIDNATSEQVIQFTSGDSAGGAKFVNTSTVTGIGIKNYKETVYSGGSTTGTITPNCANGNIQNITLTGNITFNAFASPVSGQSLVLIITQPSSGTARTLTSTMKFAGGQKTLSTANSAVDIIGVFYNGTNYFATLSKGFV